MWCPKCKNEYREGFTHCPDCDVDLVESLESIPVPVIFGEEEDLEQMATFLKLNGIGEASVTYDETEEVFELKVLPGQKEQVKEMLQAFLQDRARRQELEENGFDTEYESGETDGQNETDDAQDAAAGRPAEFAYSAAGDEQQEDIPAAGYESKRQKAEDYKSSSVALILVGAVGIVVLILLFLDMLPIRLAGSGKYLVCSVMGVLFAVFIVMGISSLKSYKKQLALADAEDETISAVKAYLAEALDRERLEREAGEHLPEGSELGELTGEQAYFPRMEVIRKSLRQQFPELEEALLDKLADDHYTELYED